MQKSEDSSRAPAALHTDRSVLEFFDRLADSYHPLHGSAERLILLHLKILRRYGTFRPEHRVLDLGCGPGYHLQALSPFIGCGLGIDLSPKMIERARRSASPVNLEFRVDDAELLTTVADCSMNRVLSVGVLSHVPDQEKVCRQVSRVLAPGGKFICLTMNGNSLWYHAVAPALGIEPRCLSSDRFLTAGRARRILLAAGFRSVTIRYWPFVPSGFMPAWTAWLLRAGDAVGRIFGAPFLRGGLLLIAER